MKNKFPPPNLLPTEKPDFSLLEKRLPKKQKPKRGFELKKLKEHDLHVGEVDDIYWPPIPGIDGPLDLANEVVGNLNKPPPRDPVEEAKYSKLYVPSAVEIYQQFVEDGPPIFEGEDTDGLYDFQPNKGKPILP